MYKVLEQQHQQLELLHLEDPQKTRIWLEIPQDGHVPYLNVDALAEQSYWDHKHGPD